MHPILSGPRSRIPSLCLCRCRRHPCAEWGGVVVKDGNEILPEREIFTYKGGSYAGFSNWFRHQLLAEKGGVWTDMDMICLRPLAFANELILAGNQAAGVANNLIIVPQGHPLMVAMAKNCREFKKREGSQFGAVGGPNVFAKMVHKMNYQSVLKPLHYFSQYGEGWRMLAFTDHWGGSLGAFGAECYTVHLCNELLRKAGISKDAVFDSASLFEVLKKKHNIAQVAHAQRISTADINALVERGLTRGKNRKKIIKATALASLIALVVCLVW